MDCNPHQLWCDLVHMDKRHTYGHTKGSKLAELAPTVCRSLPLAADMRRALPEPKPPPNPFGLRAGVPSAPSPEALDCKPSAAAAGVLGGSLAAPTPCFSGLSMSPNVCSCRTICTSLDTLSRQLSEPAVHGELSKVTSRMTLDFFPTFRV